jgi:hypothetical protein
MNADPKFRSAFIRVDPRLHLGLGRGSVALHLQGEPPRLRPRARAPWRRPA